MNRIGHTEEASTQHSAPRICRDRTTTCPPSHAARSRVPCSKLVMQDTLSQSEASIEPVAADSSFGERPSWSIGPHRLPRDSAEGRPGRRQHPRLSRGPSVLRVGEPPATPCPGQTRHPIEDGQTPSAPIQYQSSEARPRWRGPVGGHAAAHTYTLTRTERARPTAYSTAAATTKMEPR